jgi:hypothetical protein
MCGHVNPPTGSFSYIFEAYAPKLGVRKNWAILGARIALWFCETGSASAWVGKRDLPV